MLKDIKNKIKKYGFISIELVILASVMLTAGGYGISKLGNNASGSTRNETEAFNKLFEKELTEEEKKFLEFKNNISDNKVKTIYKDGEEAVSKDANSTININGIDCYVLEFNEDKTQAKLITKDIYDVRFDTGGHTGSEVGGYLGSNSSWEKTFTYSYRYSTLRKWMQNFYRNELHSNQRILPSTVTSYTVISENSYNTNFNDYAEDTIIDEYVYALDAKEAIQYANKFEWTTTDIYTKGFWITAGREHSNFHFAYAGEIRYTGKMVLGEGAVNRPECGARPSFWISLD